MKDMHKILHADLSRRDLFKKTLGTTGAIALGTLIPGGELLLPQAAAQGSGAGSVVVIYLTGGYNALFSSADSFSAGGTFGVTPVNMLDLGNGLVVDSVFSTLSPFVKERMAAVGVAHGISAHGSAQTAQFSFDNANPLMILAEAIGGSGSIKCANVGRQLAPGPRASVGSVSLQQVADMQSTIDALGGGAPDPTMPKREFAALGVAAAEAMSKPRLDANPDSLQTVSEGYKVAVQTLSTPPQPFNPEELRTAYSLNGTAVNSFPAQMAAAELMIRAGSNVVAAVDGGGLTWDTHGDRAGTRARQMFTSRILPGLKTFTDRMIRDQGPNVTVVILGDFARSLPGSDHANVTVATVFGTNVKVGTTGKVSATVGLPQGTPSVPGLWGYLAALAKAPTAVSRFGGNPHAVISRV